MFCLECGKQLPDNAKFCSVCGFAQTNSSDSPDSNKNKSNEVKIMEQLDKNTYFQEHSKSNAAKDSSPNFSDEVVGRVMLAVIVTVLLGYFVYDASYLYYLGICLGLIIYLSYINENSKS